MLTTLLLLSLRVASALAATCPTVEWPTLQPPGLYEYGVPLPSRTCEPTRNVASLMYAMDIDPIEPVMSEEYDGDVYESEEP